MTPTQQTYSNGWVWHQFKPEEKEKVQLFDASNWQFEEWVIACEERSSDYTGVRINGQDKALFGSFYYQFDANHIQEKHVFLHYYVTDHYLVTSPIDLNRFHRTNKQDLQEKFKQCETAKDAFFILVGEILNSLLDGIDHFEESLRRLEDENKKDNSGGGVLEKIVDHRYLLLHWTALTVPIEDMLLAAEEVFMDDLKESQEYQRTKLRLDRLLTLEKHYEQEIDTLLSIDDNLTNYRGNEIMRALTVFTVIFIPLTSFSAVWGMNFEQMPELEWKWGYALSLLFIFSAMLSVYFYLKKKGWTKDLLKGKK